MTNRKKIDWKNFLIVGAVAFFATLWLAGITVKQWGGAVKAKFAK